MNHASVFSGIGGFDLAAEQAGFKNIFHVEVDDDNREHLELSFPESRSYSDIRTFNAKEYAGTIDIISGGFPCQDISIAKTHTRNGQVEGIKGERSGLWKEYARVIREVGPGFVLFENSSMLLSRGFETVLCDLSELGYDVEWRCFYASQFGYPHFRPRVYGLAYPRGNRWNAIIKEGGFLQKIHTERAPRQVGVSMPFERFNSRSDFSGVLLDDGFYSRLDKKKVFGYGNAIVVDIAYYIFEMIGRYCNAEREALDAQA